VAQPAPRDQGAAFGPPFFFIDPPNIEVCVKLHEDGVNTSRGLMMQRYRFDAYVDAARNGKNAVWRIVLAVVLITIIWLAATFALLCAGTAAMMIRDGYSTIGFDDVRYAFDYEALMTDQIGLIVTLLSVASLWIGVWLALRVFHKRSLLDLFGIERRLGWPDFIRSTVVSLAVGIAAIPVGLLIDPTVMRGSISLSGWLAMAPLVLVSCFLQSSAEELAFRGYLPQVLAARFATPLIWLGVPTAVFTLLHWQGGASIAMNLAYLFVILGFSLSMTLFLMVSGNLAAGMGAHFGNNIGAVVLFSSQPDLGAAALFAGRSILDQGWTFSQAVMFGLYGVLVIVITQLLLLHPASPVRLRSLL
jgi:membrane protease YdiL (CAAX protease family)